MKHHHTLTFMLSVALGVVMGAGCDDRSRGGPSLAGMTPALHDVHFPIAQGTRHGGVSCADCHGGFESFREFTCVSCHEHEAEPMNATHQGFPGYAFESVSCYGCHPRGNVRDEVPHEVFPIRDGAAHEGVSCASCHTDPADRKKVGCTSCHEHKLQPMLAIHDGMPDYAWESSRCLSCHPGAQPTGLLNHPFFPTATGSKHSAVSCAECHANREDRAQLACTSCHEHEQAPMAAAHDGVLDYAYESSSCFACHKEAQVPGTLDHTYFPIAAGDTHAVVSCAECHTNPDTRAEIGCTTCHEHHGQPAMAAAHAGVPDYQFQSSSCLLCHPGGEPSGLIDHSAMFPIEAGQTHGGLSCRDCHKQPDDRTAVACISCHQHDQAPMAQVHAGIGGYQWDSPSCLACHPGGEATGAIDHTFFPIGAGSKHAGVSCATCHVSDSDRTVVGCTSCHEHGADPMFAIHKGMPSYAWTSTACLTCHPSAQPTGLLQHPFFPTTAGTKHAAVSCADCHASRTERSELACTTCHQHGASAMNAAHLGVPDYVYESSSCFLCHAAAQVPGEMRHSFFPIDAPAVHAAVSCAQCHTNPASRAEVGCTSCHQHAENTLAPVHVGIPDYAWDSSTCLLCHPNAERTGLIEHAYFPIATPAPHAQVSCRECHTSTTTRTEVGCASCHVAGEVDPVHSGIPGYAHTSPACVACHPQANVPGQMDHTPFFPIEGGQTHGGLSCADCHATPGDRSQLSCTSCHAHEQGPMATRHALVAGYVWEASACLTCHPQGRATGAFDHSAYFPIAAGDTHGGVSCAECHTDPSAPKTVGCTTCHAHQEADMGARHTLVPGYSWSSTACLSCHPYGDAAGNAVDHRAFFPIEAGTVHSVVGCGECHLSGSDPSVNRCKECHEGFQSLSTTHLPVGVGSGLQSSAGCKTCHAEAQVSLVSAHGPFRIASGRDHYRQRCVECHTQQRTDKTWAQDFGQWTCLGCHGQNEMNVTHADREDYSWTNPACISCHPDGSK